MKNIKKFWNAVRKLVKNIMFRAKLRHMDNMWYSIGCCSCFAMFPPSFYYKHSQEEIERITAEETEGLQELVGQFKKQWCSNSSHMI